MFVADVYPVQEQSMWPTLEGGRDHVLVDKISKAFGGSVPERFAICVFRHKPGGYSNSPEQFFVKRLIGLPNEVIDLRAGDIFIGANGEDLARLQRPPALVEKQLRAVPPEGGSLEFDPKDGRLTRDGQAWVFTPDPGRSMVATFRSSPGIDPLCIKDDHVADKRVVRGRHPVPDVRVTAGPITGEAASLAFVHEIGDGDLRKVTVDGEGIEVWSKVGGAESVRARFPRVDCQHGLRLETLDGIFRVSLRDGAGWRELYSEPRDTEHHDGFSGVRVEVTGGAARIASLEVMRDVHYAWGADTLDEKQPIPPDRVAPDRLFLVGDNPEISTDSRDLRFGPVPRSSLVGVVRAVVWPLPMHVPK